ncbi:MAG: hypothetical protein ACOCQR_00840 [bacterium]
MKLMFTEEEARELGHNLNLEVPIFEEIEVDGQRHILVDIDYARNLGFFDHWFEEIRKSRL